MHLWLPFEQDLADAMSVTTRWWGRRSQLPAGGGNGSTPASPRVLIYEPNSLNPFGRELSRLLSQAFDVVLYMASEPGSSRATRSEPVLAGRRQDDGLIRHLFKRIVGPLRPAMRSLLRDEILLVVWCRGTWDALVILVARELGAPVVVINHNPQLLRPRTHWRDRVNRMLLRRAIVTVALDETVREAAELESQRVAVCLHPAFLSLRQAEPFRSHDDDAATSQPRVLLLGALRWDKGADHVPTILTAAARPMTLVIAGPNRPPAEWDEKLLAAGVELDAPNASAPLSDEEIVARIYDSDVMLAPYIAATQSSSVILAMTCGLPVLGYDSGALSWMLTPESRVPAGDAKALGALLTQFIITPWQTFSITPDELDARALRQWISAISAMGGTTR